MSYARNHLRWTKMDNSVFGSLTSQEQITKKRIAWLETKLTLLLPTMRAENIEDPLMFGGTLLIPIWLQRWMEWPRRPSDSAELGVGPDGTVRLRDEEDDEDEDKDKDKDKGKDEDEDDEDDDL